MKIEQEKELSLYDSHRCPYDIDFYTLKYHQVLQISPLFSFIWHLTDLINLQESSIKRVSKVSVICSVNNAGRWRKRIYTHNFAYGS